jgi:hypothetical protein
VQFGINDNGSMRLVQVIRAKRLPGRAGCQDILHRQPKKVLQQQVMQRMLRVVRLTQQTRQPVVMAPFIEGKLARQEPQE